MLSHRITKALLFLSVLGGILFGGGRLYFALTDGFRLGNIETELHYESRWDVAALDDEGEAELRRILAQPFTYLGKGCQSYVFESEDGNYVIKFPKYQRFRSRPWDTLLSVIPSIKAQREERLAHKKEKLDGVFYGWKLAYEEMQEQTGVLYVHLNPTVKIDRHLTLYDKLGFSHHVDLDQSQFLVQKKAEMLCPTLEAAMAHHEPEEAEALIDELLSMVVVEYRNGYADNDHALIQNTGVLHGKPVHIDVGQLDKGERFAEIEVFNQELFNKMYKFRIWLFENYPELYNYLDGKLKPILGDQLQTMVPTHLEEELWHYPFSG